MSDKKTFKEKLLKAIGLSTSETKNLIRSVLNDSGKNFISNLINYNWKNTRDYNVALIILCFYYYCITSNDPKLKTFTNQIKQEHSNAHQLLERLKQGDGAGIARCMGHLFDCTLDYALQKCESEEQSRKNVITNLKNRTKKITRWKINKKNIENLVNSIIGESPAPEEQQIQLTKFEQDLNKSLSAYKNSSETPKQEATISTLINFFTFCIDHQNDANPNIPYVKAIATQKQNINTQNIILGLLSEDNQKIQNSYGMIFTNALYDTLKYLNISDNRVDIVINFMEKLSKIDSKSALTDNPLLRTKIEILAAYYNIKIPKYDKKPESGDKKTESGDKKPQPGKQNPQIESLVDGLCKTLPNPDPDKPTCEKIFSDIKTLLGELKSKTQEEKNECVRRIKEACKNKPMGKENKCYWDDIFEKSLQFNDGHVYYPCGKFSFELDNTTTFKQQFDIFENHELTFMLSSKAKKKFNLLTWNAMKLGGIKIDVPNKDVLLDKTAKNLLNGQIGDWKIIHNVHLVALLDAK